LSDEPPGVKKRVLRRVLGRVAVAQHAIVLHRYKRGQ
jgi:hypothetical protein